MVACSISFDAPVVMEWKISSSAARPPVSVAILFRISSFVISVWSPSSTCMVKPSAPDVRGTMVIFCTGALFVCKAATSAWPTSW